MIARYAGGESGARAAARTGSVVVVVDAFRTSVTIAVLISKGARVVPVASAEEAAAGAILHRLRSRGAELEGRARRIVEEYLSRSSGTLRNNSAARRLKRLGDEEDLEFCLAEDTVSVVPRLVGDAFVG